MSTLADRLKGKFIVLDGPDGSGKSTQLARLREHLAGQGAQVESVHDPGTTEVGERIRATLLERGHARIGAMCETLLFMASRAQLVEERICPALAAGKVVLCDRFISATLAYQGALGVDRQAILSIGDSAVQGVWPDLTVILDVPPEVGLHRRGAPRGKPPGGLDETSQMALFGDRLEGRNLDYHRQVRQNFRDLPRFYPHPAVCIPADCRPDEVFQAVLGALGEAFPDSDA